MDNAVAGLLGALVGGVATLAGGWLQGKQQLTALTKQLMHQQQMAIDAHAREQTANENLRRLDQLILQTDYGHRATKAAWMFQLTGPKSANDAERISACNEALTEAGLSRADPTPYPSFLQGEEIEDEELRELVASHRERILGLELAFMFMDYTKLPNDCKKLKIEVDDFARQIHMRWRRLQREGKPI